MLIWRHTFPILARDGHTMKEICNIGIDRDTKIVSRWDLDVNKESRIRVV